MGPCSGPFPYRNARSNKEKVQTGKTRKDKQSGKHARTAAHKATAGGNRASSASYRQAVNQS